MNFFPVVASHTHTHFVKINFADLITALFYAKNLRVLMNHYKKNEP